MRKKKSRRSFPTTLIETKRDDMILYWECVVFIFGRGYEIFECYSTVVIEAGTANAHMMNIAARNGRHCLRPYDEFSSI